MRSMAIFGVLILAFLAFGCGGDAPPAQQAAAEVAPPPSKFTVAPSFRTADLSKLAVIVGDKTGHYGEAGALADIEDQFTSALLAKGYRLASRSELAAVMKEQTLQGSSGLTSEADAAKIGQLLNVPAVLIVNVTSLTVHQDSKYDPLSGGNLNVFGRKAILVADASIGAKLISVQTAEVLCSGTNKGSTEVGDRAEATQAAGPVANELAQGFPAAPTH